MILADTKRLYDPLWIIGALWSYTLLTPHLPGVPRSAIGGLPWRQELCLALLLTATLALLIKRTGVRNRFSAVIRPQLASLLFGTLFVAWMWVSASWAAYPYASVHQSFQWSAYLIFFGLMTAVAQRQKLLRASFVSLVIVVWILGISGMIESWFGAPLTDGNMRGNAKPLFRASGSYGEIMAVAAPLFAAIALHVRRRRAALICGATATLAWLGALQALQRAPLIGALIGLLLLFGVSFIKPNCRPRKWSRAAALAAALFTVAALQTLPSPLTRQETSTIARIGEGVSEDSHTHIRILLWGIGMEMLRARPLTGVGANNYEIAFPEARAAISARYADSNFVNLEEERRAVYAHNEYVQILAELGIVGFLLFATFCFSLLVLLWRALRHPRAALPALGAGGGMIAFLLSSGASASSFRSAGGSLVFFYAAALVAATASRVTSTSETETASRFSLASPLLPATCALASLMLCFTIAQAAVSILNGLAEASADAARTERLYQTSLTINPAQPPTHFSYGEWLDSARRAEEALPHLRYAVSRGFNSSICYAYLAEAEQRAGDLATAERTLSDAARIYPRSVFLNVLHAEALNRLKRDTEAERQFAYALDLNEKQARGWRQLIRFGKKAAAVAARSDEATATPGALLPSDAVFIVLSEEDKRAPSS